MKKPATFVLIYALFVTAGGSAGYFIANSLPSLIAGLTFGTLIAFNAIRMFKGHIKGQQLALIQTIVLASFFVYRYQTTHKLMPAVPMIALSTILAIYLLLSMPKVTQNS